MVGKEDQILWDFHEIENRQSFLLAGPRLEFLAKEIFKIKNIKEILEIGFGDGYLLELLSKEKNFKLYGIDISEKNVEKTKEELMKKGISINLKFGSIDQIPFGDKQFDLVVASEVLEHLDEKTSKKGLLEIKRVLKHNGIFMGTVPANENLQDNFCFCPKCGNVFHRWGHKQSFTNPRLLNLFKEAGFEVLTIKMLTFFGEHLINNKIITKIKFQIRKLLFNLFKRIFANQWLLFFLVKRAKK